MLNDISINVAEAIPYRDFEEKTKIVEEELSKDRYVEIIEDCKLIYSAQKWKRRRVYGRCRKVYLQAR